MNRFNGWMLTVPVIVVAVLLHQLASPAPAQNAAPLAPVGEWQVTAVTVERSGDQNNNRETAILTNTKTGQTYALSTFRDNAGKEVYVWTGIPGPR